MSFHGGFIGSVLAVLFFARQNLAPLFSVFDVVAAGLGPTGRLLAQYHDASHRVQLDATDAAMKELGRLHDALDRANAWQIHSRVETALEHLSLDPDAEFAKASGGRKRQTLLARALVSEPDVLLLDEPTNHLDVSAVEWLESFVIEQNITLVFVTHDRAFLRRVATRIVDLDRGRLVDWGTGYDAYLEKKDAALANEEREWALFDKKLAQEEVWIRTGIQARRTRNEGRVRALESLRLERAARRDRVGQVNLRADEAERSGRLVVEAKNVSLAFGEREIIRNFSTTIIRGSRIGLIGPNGSGKTTLLKLLLGQLIPDDGTIRLGTNLEVAYFDQLREQLDPERSVLENIADTEYIEIGGARKHVMGYLQDFLFSPERARTPVRVLSGGERNRLLLARLFTRSFNLLVLDEPTNDLDIETLELLETMLLQFNGTLLLVSHDRAFLDNVVTSTYVFEGKGIVSEYVGGYSDWLRQRPLVVNAGRVAAPATPPKAAPKKERLRKISIKEKAELGRLPEKIEAAERERDELYQKLADANFLRNGQAVAQAKARLEALIGETDALMGRWAELEALAGS